MRTLNVDLPSKSVERGYPIVIGENLLTAPGLLDDVLDDRSVVLVSNETVMPLYGAQIKAQLGSRLCTDVILPDGEAYKTLDCIDQILTAAIAARHERRSIFIALGGGVIGDMTGFAAACFLRGADFIQVPTTLLAQVDSSVGGKTGVNHPLGKNLIGAFHQPRKVVIDLATLTTLSAREFAAGMAEVIKYGCIYDASFFDWLEHSAGALAERDQAAMATAIERSCAIKAEVVAQDEREAGLRAILNFGHTFGHAIETTQGYGQWLHGEAVAAGMQIATEISAARGAVSTDFVDRLKALLKAFDLPTTAPTDMGVDRFLEAMAGDKKVERGTIRYVLLSEVGRAAIAADVTRDEIEQALLK